MTAQETPRDRKRIIVPCVAVCAQLLASIVFNLDQGVFVGVPELRRARHDVSGVRGNAAESRCYACDLSRHR
jgi:hypothetical protein